MNNCVRNKEHTTDLMKHGLYKGVQRYICRPCKNEYVRNYRSNTVATHTKRVATSVDDVATVSTIDDDTDIVERSFSLTQVDFNV